MEFLYNAVLVSTVQQGESLIIIYAFPLEPPPLSPPAQVITETQAGLPVGYSSSPLAVYFTRAHLYVST